MRARLASILTLLALLAGCSLWNNTPTTDYRTVAEAPTRDPDLAKEKNQQAIEQFSKGHLAKAEQLVQEALVADVSYGPAHNTLGKVYFHQQKYYLAAWEFEYALKVMPNQPEPMNNLGQVYEAVGKLDEAVEQYESAHATAPDQPEFLGNLLRARIRRGDQTDDLVLMLEQFIFMEVRPEWVAWAKHELTFRRVQQQTQKNLSPQSSPPPEEVPRPAPTPLLPPVPETTLPSPLWQLPEGPLPQ
jgi:tetratricopeptide (TPR) repeat protein